MPARATVVANGFGAYSARVHARIHDVVYAAATNIAERAAVSMEGAKSGRIYGKRKHQASAPGEAPAIDMGILHASLRVFDVDDLSAAAGTDVEYGPHLEFGTRNIEARPFILPAAEVERSPFAEAIAAAVKE